MARSRCWVEHHPVLESAARRGGSGRRVRALRGAVAASTSDAVKASLLAEGWAARGGRTPLAELKAIRVSAAGRLGDRRGTRRSIWTESSPTRSWTWPRLANACSSCAAKPTSCIRAVVVARGRADLARSWPPAKLTCATSRTPFLDQYLAVEAKRALGRWVATGSRVPGAQLFARIEGDYFGILGLPLRACSTSCAATGAHRMITGRTVVAGIVVPAVAALSLSPVIHNACSPRPESTASTSLPRRTAGLPPPGGRIPGCAGCGAST